MNFDIFELLDVNDCYETQTAKEIDCDTKEIDCDTFVNYTVYVIAPNGKKTPFIYGL